MEREGGKLSKEVIVIGFKDIKKYSVNHVINTTSRSTNWTKEFSPFTLGPVDLYGGHVAKNVENAWQFTKVYKEHENDKGDPNEAYYEWAKIGWEDTFAHRYPMGKGMIPLYSYWDGQKLDYIEARKKIYAPLYARAVVKTEAFQKLLDLYKSEETFVLLDFDGYDYLSMGMTLKEVLNEPKKKMGHAFVLAMLLQYPKVRFNCGYVEK